jgi:N-acetylneuraminic acid mutarotase
MMQENSSKVAGDREMIKETYKKLLIALMLMWLLTCAAPASECSYDLPGDFNHDCQVDFSDFLILAQNWLVDCISEPKNPACSCHMKWIAEPPMFTGRNQFCGGVINGRIYIFGGNDRHANNLKTTEGYDPNTMQWIRLADNNHNNYQGVEELTSAVVNNKLYVFGAWGWDGSERYSAVLNFNETYDPATNRWTTLQRKPTTVAAAPSTVYKDEIYLFGGYCCGSEDTSQTHYSVVECYNPSSNTWRFVTNMPKRLANMAVTTIGSKAYLFGGYDHTTEQLVDDVITYDFETGIWSEDLTRLPVRMVYHYSEAAKVIDGKVYLIGGFEADGDGYRWSNRIDIYDPADNTWEIGPSLPMPLDGPVTTVIGHKIYFLGGYNNWSFKNGPMTGVISLDTRLCSQ